MELHKRFKYIEMKQGVEDIPDYKHVLVLQFNNNLTNSDYST
jgi:hypothetical protein